MKSVLLLGQSNMAGRGLLQEVKSLQFYGIREKMTVRAESIKSTIRS